MLTGLRSGIRETPDIRTYFSHWPLLSMGAGLSRGAGRDKLHRCLNGESQRGAARDVERQMGANIDAGQPDQGDGAQRKGAANRAEAGNRGRGGGSRKAAPPAAAGGLSA